MSFKVLNSQDGANTLRQHVLGTGRRRDQSRGRLVVQTLFATEERRCQ